jgi:uncharacterized protein (DUF305 family)
LRARTPLRNLAPTVVIVIVLVGCGPDAGGPEGTAPGGQGSDPGEAAGTNGEPDDGRDVETGYNDADVEFMQGMIPHHMQAVRMAEMVPDRTASEELDQLADDIIASQTEEISLMREMLGEAGADAPGMGGGGMGMDGDGPMGDDGAGDMGDDGMGDMGEGMGGEGMLSPDEMHELMASEEREFDRLWSDGMIDHHEGALDSAERVIDDGEHPRVRELAEDIIAAQEREIDQMRQWQNEWEQS